MKVTHEQVLDALGNIPDEELANYQFYAPWQVGERDYGGYEDELKVRLAGIDRKNSSDYYKVIQLFLWEKFQENPWINTTVIDHTGRLTGRGFEVTSPIKEIRDVIELISDDPRNKLWENGPKFVARQRVEGELFLCLSVHNNGFIEIDFIDPGTICDGDMGSGKIFHPLKPSFPLAYCITGTSSDGITKVKRQIPSINLAYYPELFSVLEKCRKYDKVLIDDCRNSNKKFKKLGGFCQFIIEWDTGLFTTRNVSSLRTTLEWINHYETLKKYEIDHKKASGAYLWVITVSDPRAFKTWLSLTPEQKKETGILEQYAPGGKIILPPGLEMKAVNPTLPKISDADTDILHMVTAGLNAPEDMITGQSKGTFASVKASRAPQGDRVSDRIEEYERFLRFVFWRSVFFLHASVTTFKNNYKVEEAIEFVNQEPVYKKVPKEAYKLLEINFPISEVGDTEAVARANLGVKHGSVVDTLGVPASDVAKKMGYGCYRTARLRKATEDKIFPELLPSVDQESNQEITEGEVPKSGKKKKPKVVDKKGGTKDQTE